MLYFGNTICAAQMSARPKSSNLFYEKLSIYVSPRVSGINIPMNMAILFQTGMKYFVKQCMIFSHLGTNSYNTY